MTLYLSPCPIRFGEGHGLKFIGFSRFSAVEFFVFRKTEMCEGFLLLKIWF